MRIIAGKAKGVRLSAPKGLEIRPTLDRVREALFSIIGPRIEGAAFLDLFAGTGANGIEALSRGARLCAFVDHDRRALAAIERNLEAAHLADLAEIHRLTLPEGLRELSPPGSRVACQSGDWRSREGYDFIFADPPYAIDSYESLLSGIADGSLLAPDGMVIIEHAARIVIKGDNTGLEEVRLAKYGDTALSFLS